MIQDNLFLEYSKDKTNTELRNTIAMEHIYLVPIAIKINGLYDKRYNDYSEVIQEGIYILLKAVENFNPYKGCKFSTYFVNCSKGINKNKNYYNTYNSLDANINGYEALKLLDVIEYKEIDYDDVDKNHSLNMAIKQAMKYEFSEKDYVILTNYHGLNGKYMTYSNLTKEMKISSNTITKAKKKLVALQPKFDYYNIRSSSLYLGDKTSKTNRINNPVEDYVIWKISLEEELNYSSWMTS